MKQFLIRLAVFSAFIVVLAEILIRILHLVPDIPERYVDSEGIQRYKNGQSGYYNEGLVEWKVNQYGWLGVHEVKQDSTISVIGDSYIENMMNPIECNQGKFLKDDIPQYAFFEAGRSGVTFIEAMEISRSLDKEINPRLHLLYLSSNDFLESIVEVSKISDRVQISLKKEEIIPSKLKNPGLKKVLYNTKVLYYLYLNNPILVEKQNRGEVHHGPKIITPEQIDLISRMLTFCSESYDMSNLVFVLHPGIDERIVEILDHMEVKLVKLDPSGDEDWAIGSHDAHWSCYGHSRVAGQVSNYLISKGLL